MFNRCELDRVGCRIRKDTRIASFFATAAIALPQVAQAHVPIAQSLRDGDGPSASTLLRNHDGEWGIRARRRTRRARPVPATAQPR